MTPNSTRLLIVLAIATAAAVFAQEEPPTPIQPAVPEVEDLRTAVARLNEMVGQLQDDVLGLQQQVGQASQLDNIERLLLGETKESQTLRFRLQQAMQGKLFIANNTDRMQVITVNGTAWRIPGNETRFIIVPIGVVAIKEAGKESEFVGDDELPHGWTLDSGEFVLHYELSSVDRDSTEPTPDDL